MQNKLDINWNKLAHNIRESYQFRTRGIVNPKYKFHMLHTANVLRAEGFDYSATGQNVFYD